MNWTLDQLDAFVMSVKQGSFSAAARKLGKAQSRVSTAIANLEADLGFELFDRSARLPVLTSAGEEMFLEAQAVLDQCQRLEARAMTSAVGEEIALVVAMDEAVPIVSFECFFQTIGELFPQLKLTIINGSRDDIAKWVDEKKADLGILFHLNQLPDSLEMMPIGQFKNILITAPNHGLVSDTPPTLNDLNGYRQLVIRDRVGETQEKPISANHWYIDSYYYITSLVIRGLGWALVPEHIVESDWYTDQVVELSTENIPSSLWVEMAVVKRRDKGCGKVMNWMIDEIERMYKAEYSTVKKGQ
ncbi:LysR family transcriptional regulator [Vibrio sp. Of7-15]|uniref:LysR family transcriptional regulator n=1 Tax=Vibrio sp. Of7-15 TaxID=2724879 RepID=UPI001EF1C224|nr:LysR family transcriptional regulator [Vibrio sp. Of7-15]MCG7498253.1 LysR family transcriptional regulator [Vibrio sp. Of7-15]